MSHPHPPPKPSIISKPFTLEFERRTQHNILTFREWGQRNRATLQILKAEVEWWRQTYPDVNVPEDVVIRAVEQEKPKTDMTGEEVKEMVKRENERRYWEGLKREVKWPGSEGEG